MVESIQALIARRGQLKAAITRFSTYIQSEGREVVQIETRKAKIEKNWYKFERVQSAIEKNDEEERNASEHYPYRIEFENLYFKVVSEAEICIRASKKDNSKVETKNLIDWGQNSEEKTQRNSTKSIVRLAPLNIPVFSGKYDEWMSFKDNYMSVIYTNEDLTAIEKFFYLRSSLSNDAASCIKYLETTATNYEIAWRSLINRYDNKKVLIQTHVKNIVDLPSINESTSTKLRQLSDDLVSNMKALETLGQKPKEWGPLLLHTLCSKLDNETLKEWEIKLVKDKIPSVTELIKFIEDRFQISESIESWKYINKELAAKEKVLTKFSKNNKYKAATSSTTFTSTATAVCYAYQPHTIYKCPVFTSLSARDRIDKVVQLDLCKICLRKHSGGKCFGKYCFKCNKPHNTMLQLNQKPNHEQVVNTDKGEPAAMTSTTAHVSNETDNVLLGTAVVEVFGLNGEKTYARALLDSGSTNHFICSELVNN